MTQTEFDQTTDGLTRHADSIIDAKRCDYTEQNVDVLHNFKASAVAAGITPLQAWLVHWHKQSSAVSRFIKNPSIPPSEPMLSRFADLRNYLQLGYALMVESVLNKKVPSNHSINLAELNPRQRIEIALQEKTRQDKIISDLKRDELIKEIKGTFRAVNNPDGTVTEFFDEMV